MLWFSTAACLHCLILYECNGRKYGCIETCGCENFVSGSEGSSQLDGPRWTELIKNKWEKDHQVKDYKASPKPNIGAGSVLGSWFLFGFCKRLLLWNGKITIALRTIPIFFFASELDTRTSICLRKSETRDRAGRLSESPNFSFSLMLKNLCRKLTQRAATIGAFGVSSAGKAGLLVWNSREWALLSPTAVPV